MDTLPQRYLEQPGLEWIGAIGFQSGNVYTVPYTRMELLLGLYSGDEDEDGSDEDGGEDIGGHDDRGDEDGGHEAGLGEGKKARI